MPRKLKSQDGNPYEIIRGMWEGAYVSHFVQLFRKKFGFSFLTTQDIEDAFISEESVTIADICARLLRYLTDNTNIRIANFDSFLRNLLIKEKADVPRFLNNGTTWWDLNPEEKLGIVKWLIDHVHQEKEEEFADYLDENYNPDDLRGICAGHDAFNNIYWYLDDLRLYREISKKQNKKEWECVCATLSEWYTFLKQFRKTTNLQEKELYTYLNFELFPLIELELLKKKSCDKEADNIFLLKRESEELEDMLEKKTFLECSNGLVKTLELNGTDTNCHEKHNGTINNVKCTSDGNGLTDFKIKTEDNNSVCDGHLNISETVCSINSTLSAAKMDVKTSIVTSANNACGSSCSTTCTIAHTQPSNVSISESSSVCGNGSHCSNSNSSIMLPSSRDNSHDGPGSMQQPSSDNPSDSCSVTSNKENAPPTSGNSGTDIPPMSAMSNMVGSTSTPATSASVQPLPSNMVNKTSFPLETQYMQQQSQIFVFSTELANKAAESCLSGHFPSIIAFHCAQPGTQSFLEKYPLKVQQFNRQNPAAWLNTLASMKQGGRPIKGAINQFPGAHGMNNRCTAPSPCGPSPMPCTGPCNIHGANLCSTPRGQGPWQNVMGPNTVGPGMIGEICGPGGSQSWTPQQQYTVNPRLPNTISQGMNMRHIGPSNNNIMPCGANMSGPGGMGAVPFIPGPGNQSTLTGVKVPDENLTPEQRQHRVEQLATIRKMQQLLFPEQQQIEQSQGGMGGPPSNMVPVVGGMMQHNSQARFGPGGEMCVHPGMEPCFSPHQACITDHDHSHPQTDMFMSPGMMSPNFHQQNFPPVSVAAQMKWQELQNQFYEERRKKPHCSGTPLSHASNIVQGQQQTPIQQLQNQQSQMLQQPPQPQTPVQQPVLNSPSPNMGLSPGTRIQGPPPPYHQTTRRGMPSPHPASPNPSSLSLPSPRMVSGLSSPADPTRQFPHPTPPGPRLPHPSPGTATSAGSSSLHTTPLNSPKPLNSSSGPGSNSGSLIKTPTTPSNTASTPTDTPTSSCVNALPSSGPSTPAGQCVNNRKQGTSCTDVQDPASVLPPSNASTDFTSNSGSVSTPNTIQNELFCHNSHQCSQSGMKSEHSAPHPPMCQKEPTSLMPVPSPQQIEYLNEFDGQELTIQKQPNRRSVQSMTSSMAINSNSQPHFQSPDTTSFPNTPGSCPALENSQDSLSGRYPASAPASMEGMQRFAVLSPQLQSFDNPRHMLPVQPGDNTIQRFPGAHNMEVMKLPGPNVVVHSGMDEVNVRFPGQSSQAQMFGPTPGNGMESLRFANSAPETMQRFRGPSPHGSAPMEMMHSRFVGSSPLMQTVETMGHTTPFAMRPESMPSQSFSSPAQTMASNSSPCLSGAFASDNNMTHSHLHNLQKMTPPFDGIVGNKVSSEVASSPLQCPPNPTLNNSSCANVASFGGGSPLTPHRLSHFDPIASMAAMSESTGPLVTAVGSSPTAQNMIVSHINMPGGAVNDQENVNFNPNMPSQNMLQNSVTPNHLNRYNMSPQMAHIPCGPQNMNNSYMNTGMSVQPMNVQNVTTTALNAGVQPPSMNPHIPVHNHPSGCQDGNTNTMSCSVTTNHPIMHSAVSAKTSNVNMCVSGPRPNHPLFAGQPIHRNTVPVGAAVSPTMMVRPSGAPTGCFNSANVQVKASAPNTIQYLPARPQNVSTTSNRPPTLEFLQRFAAPLTNLDNKVPTHNLQYFPNSRGSNTPTGHGGVAMIPASSGVSPTMMGNQRPVNMMMGPMMRGTSPISHTGSQMFPVGTGMPGSESSMFGRPQCPQGPQMVPVNAMSGGQGIFPNKQMPMPMGGMAPDATQPLPPSMGQSFNYKQSPFYGPTTADPNYAVQFHNFQQQLYATNTRGNQMSSQNNLSGQGFFGPK